MSPLIQKPATKYHPPIFHLQKIRGVNHSRMATLKYFSISNTQILASAGHNNTKTTSHSISNTPPSLPTLNNNTPQKLKPPKKNKKNKPSIAEIEQAIGAGPFRDPAIYRRLESGSDLGGEWPIEKKLREVGEWLIEATGSSSDTSSRKGILKTVFMWILPMWVLAFLLAARIIELPFGSPFLDDLLL